MPQQLLRMQEGRNFGIRSTGIEHSYDGGRDAVNVGGVVPLSDQQLPD